MSSYICFSQTTGSNIKPDKVEKDSTGQTYWSWITPKVKTMAKELETGRKNAEKVKEYEKLSALQQEQIKTQIKIIDNLKETNEKSEKTISNQKKMLENNEKALKNSDEAIEHQGQTINK